MRFPGNKKINIGNHGFFSSILLGITFGLSVYSYWLVDIFPLTSPKIVVFLIFAGLIGTFGYFALLDLWIIPCFAKFQRIERRKSILWGILIGLVVMFAGTSAWTSPTRYINFLLPNQNLEITVPLSKDGNTPDVSILWMTTSLGDVSYDSMRFEGWERDRNHLVLNKSVENSIHWQGKTGNEAMILFRKSPAGGPVTISWNGETEVINLNSPVIGTYQYKYRFGVPFYASVAVVWLIVLVNFIVIGVALCALFFIKKSVLAENIKRSVTVVSASGQQQKPSVEIAVIALFIFLAFLLRAFNLENLYPYADEYIHLLAAKALLAGASLGAVYERSLFIVTLPVVVSYSLFGESLWAARLPGVIFSALGIIPLYLITRKINRQVAILSCLLFATSPYVIAFSRNVREYAYTPFYFYWVVYFMMLFLQGFPSGFVFFRDWKKLQWRYLALTPLLLLSILYVLVFDRLSTFKLILIAFGIFALFLFAKFDLRNWGNRIVIVLMPMTVLVAMGRNIRWFLKLPEITMRSLEYFFLNPPQQWYFERLVVVPVLVLLAGFYFAFLVRRTTFIPALFCILYAGYMFFFIFAFKGTGFNLHPRFVLAAQIWFIPILAMGMYMTWELLRSLFCGRKTLLLLSTCILLLATVNVRQILLPTFFRGELMPVTNLVHDDLGAADEYIRGHLNENEVLIGSLYAEYAEWQGKLAFERIYNYSDGILRKNKDGYSYIASIIEQYPAGWIVIDEQRMDYVPLSLPKGQTVIHGKTVDYMGKFLSQYIWHWSVK
jgi:hypothetical protein